MVLSTFEDVYKYKSDNFYWRSSTIYIIFTLKRMISRAITTIMSVATTTPILSNIAWRRLAFFRSSSPPSRCVWPSIPCFSDSSWLGKITFWNFWTSHHSDFHLSLSQLHVDLGQLSKFCHCEKVSLSLVAWDDAVGDELISQDCMFLNCIDFTSGGRPTATL